MNSCSKKKIYLTKSRLIQYKDIYKTFQQFISSINNQDLSAFMDIQHNEEENPFYLEQNRWFKELHLQKKDGFLFSFRIVSLKRKNHDVVVLGIDAKVTRPSGRSKILKSEYVLLKKDNIWKFNDFPFKVMKSEVCSLLYLENNVELARHVFEYMKSITSYYKEIFNWEPEKIILKFFNTLEQLSFTIPWFATYGWNEHKESIKIALPFYVENKERVLFSLLLHEISHKMLSDLSNDNASLYLQEGLAIFLEKGHYIKEGKIYFCEKSIENFHKELLRNNEINRNITLDELNKLTYNDGEKLYHYGFLIAYSLIKKYGLSIFCTIASNLSSNSYIDKRAHRKIALANRITFAALNHQVLSVNPK
jgi:hypothetical protein